MRSAHFPDAFPRPLLMAWGMCSKARRDCKLLLRGAIVLPVVSAAYGMVKLHNIYKAAMHMYGAGRSAVEFPRCVAGRGAAT